MGLQFKQKILNLQDLILFQGAKLKIGVMGGSFDPAHSGHLLIAKQALNYYNFDYIIWLVAKQNPLKKQASSNIFTRCQSAATLAKHPRIIISSVENDLQSNFTINSLEFLINRFPKIKFSWIMGVDNLIQLQKWYRHHDLINLCDVIIFDRPVKQRLINVESLISKIDKKAKTSIMISRMKMDESSSSKIREVLK